MVFFLAGDHELVFLFVCSSDGTGQVNQAGVDHYNRFIDALLSKGM
jgi:hypothetical protein